MFKLVRKLLKPAPSSPPASYKQWWTDRTCSPDAAKEATIGAITWDDYEARGLHGDENSPGALELARMATLGPDSVVLEIGCGIARIGYHLAPLVREWHGADIAAPMLAIAAKRLEGRPNTVLHELAEGRGLAPLPGEAYDFVYATVVLMHLDKEDVLALMRECYRVLKPAGLAYFDTWNILHPDTFRTWSHGMATGAGKPRGRHQCATVDELRVYGENSGFESVQADGSGRLAKVLLRKCAGHPRGKPFASCDGSPPFGYLGHPHNQSVVRGAQIECTGWALDCVACVRIHLNDAPPLEASLNHASPDLPPLFPRYPGASHGGFHCILEPPHLRPGRNTIRIVAEDSSGASTTLTGDEVAFHWES